MLDIRKPVRRRCASPLPRSFGREGGKRLVVIVAPPDLIGLRPERSRRCVFVSIGAIYSIALKMEAQRSRQERAARRAARKR